MTLFPQMMEPVISTSIIGRARSAGHIDIQVHQIRDYTLDRHYRTDHPPYGGGKGMLMSADPIYNNYQAIRMQTDTKPHVIFMSPQGKVFHQQRAFELAEMDHIAILCGHYEGVDQRIIDEIVDEELSIGDYVLTGGELPALVVTEAVARLHDGVLADDTCWQEESHTHGLLEYPQYTRPEVWNDHRVPPVLLSGHHANIERWRREQALLKTARMRPELLHTAELTPEDIAFLQSHGYMQMD